MYFCKNLFRPVEHVGEIQFSFRNKVLRGVWTIVWLMLASWTPAKFALWRRFLLRIFGASLTSTSDVRSGCRIWFPANLIMEEQTVIADRVNCYNMAPVKICKGTIISQGVHICAGTHDHSKLNHPLVVRPIEIGREVWVAAEAFISPGTIISDGCVIGARSVVYGELEAWSIYSGNPAKVVKQRSIATRVEADDA